GLHFQAQLPRISSLSCHPNILRFAYISRLKAALSQSTTTCFTMSIDSETEPTDPYEVRVEFELELTGTQDFGEKPIESGIFGAENSSVKFIIRAEKKWCKSFFYLILASCHE